MNKKFIYFKTKAQFTAKLSSLPNNAIVFIEDTKQIWTHGVFFDTSWNYVGDKPDTYAPSAHTLGSHSDVTLASLANGNILRYNGSKWVNNTLAQAGIATPTDITNAISAIEIGGRNLIKGGFTNGQWHQASVGSNDVGSRGRTVEVIGLEVGKEYSFSMKSGTQVLTNGIWITFRNADNTYNTVIVRSVANFKFIAPAPLCTISYNASFATGYYGGDYFRDRLPKLEKGNKATDWTPAPEDQVSDWNTTDVNSFSYIKNKPTLLSQFTDNIGVATHIANEDNPHNVTKSQVGLSNVDNTSDLLKPISNAVQSALNLKANLASPTFTGNVTAPTFIGSLDGNANTANYLSINWTTDLNAVTDTGVYRQELPSSGYPYTSTLNMRSSDGRQQLTISRGGSGMKFRGVNSGSGTTGWTDWKEVYHTGNFANGTTSQYIRGDGSLATYSDTTYSAGTKTLLQSGTNTSNRVWSSKTLKDWYLEEIDLLLDSDRFTGSTFSSNVIDLTNVNGSFNVDSVNNYTTYTLSNKKVRGAWARVLVNTSLPITVTGVKLINLGSDFEFNTNMYLNVMYDGINTLGYYTKVAGNMTASYCISTSWDLTIFTNTNTPISNFSTNSTLYINGVSASKGIIKSIYFSDEYSSTTSIGNYFLYQLVSLTSVDLSSLTNVTTIGNYFLGACNLLTSVDLSSLTNVTTIGSYFLQSCSKLTSLDLSSMTNLTSIGSNFLYSTGVKTLKMGALVPPTLGSLSFPPGLTSILVPSAAVNAYKSATYWSDKASIISGY